MKKLVVLPLLMVCAILPAHGTDLYSDDLATSPSVTNESNSASPDGAVASNLIAQLKKQSEHAQPVQISSDGIHIGGPRPVDIDIGPGLHGSAVHALVPLVALTVPFIFLSLLSALFFFFRHRRTRTLHETLRLMIEKGVPIPPELIVPPDRGVRWRIASDLRSGMVLLGGGLGISFISPMGKIGLVVMLVGAAFLITWFIEKKNNKNDVPPTI